MRKSRTADERDAFEAADVFVWNHGARRKVKVRANRYDRRTNRQAIRSGQIER